MSVAQQLQLAGIAEPPPISSLPAIGWWICASFLLVMVAVIIWFALKKWHQCQCKKRSLQLLDALWQDFSQNAELPNQFNGLLKRHLAQAGFPEVLTLYGDQWLQFLQQQLATKFHQDVAGFVNALYRPQNSDPAQQQFLYQQLKHWIRALPC